MDHLAKLIQPGDKVHVDFMSKGEIVGTCVETSVVEFMRKYRIHFNDSCEDLWLDNYMVRHMITEN